LTCPVDHTFDPLAADYLADPYPAFARYREEQPVFFSSVMNSYIVTRYEDIDYILMNPDSFSSANTVTPLWEVANETKAILARSFERVPTLTNADGERHARMRRYVSRVLSPRQLVKLRPTIEATTHHLIDEITGKDVSDFYADLAYPLPAITAFTLLGFPSADTEQLKSWVTDRQVLTWGRASGEAQARVAENVVAFSDYIEKIIQERIAAPQDDVISKLVTMHHEDPGALTLVDIANIVFLLSAGAHESTTNLLVHAVRRLLENREQWSSICQDQSLIPNAIEEALRYDASAVAWPRITRHDTVIGSVQVPAGSPILIVFGAANRDEAVFENAESFDIHRGVAKKHLSFGKGIHFCLGAPLARMELDIVLTALTRRAPDLELVAEQAFPYQENVVMRSPQQLLVRAGHPAVPRPDAAVDGSAVAGSPRISIDRDACIGSEMCLAAAPDAFELDGEGVAVTTGKVTGLPLSSLRAIVAQCPSGALRLNEGSD
jgi:cytochrome P450/ferredoxin